MSVEDDIKRYERYEQEIAVLKAQNPKIARIQAKRDLEIARSTSREYQEMRSFRVIAPAIALACVLVLGSIGGCSVLVWGDNPDKQKTKQVAITACEKTDGRWSNNGDGACLDKDD